MFLDSDRTLPSAAKNAYEPSLGFIGEQPLNVPNYLFHSSAKDTQKSLNLPYAHCKGIAALILGRPLQEQYTKSEKLTAFLKRREMTFSKLTKSGEYKIFSVPCTTTPLPIPKSLFDAIESSAQVLVASLRLVLQDLYGSQSVRKSRFAASLPESVKNAFVSTVERSPGYFPELHHPVMKDYPFFDVVGLDLVLTEDYSDAMGAGAGVRLVPKDLPLRLLEINAGSPSGASNNQHILEGMASIDPETLKAAGRVFPNDHFEVLRQTYQTLGHEWTGIEEAVQILLPPGGSSGAAPEIHQLAQKSGIIYSDAGQIYQDASGALRLRTATGKDPVVNAIYSRVNSDSILFDLERGVTLRDAESGKPLYVHDPLSLEKSKKPKLLLDQDGEPIPLESHYAIPSAIAAIHAKKLYVGGLNRVLDNKVILSILCEYAPLVYKAELSALGLDLDSVMRLMPPQTLPSTEEAVQVIEENPEDWVIKSPNLSGGKGVYILKTLTPSERKKIIEKAKAQPKNYAYQKLVRIARLPVAHKSLEGDYRFQNLAADLRMWAFYGAGDTFRVPRLTRNGLIRTAPQEKGPLSSIVNTSMGGGYAPLLVIDDQNSSEAVEALDAAISKTDQPIIRSTLLPLFASAQLLQIAQIVWVLRDRIQKAQAASKEIDLGNVYFDLLTLRTQSREVLSYLHPKNMEAINDVISSLEGVFESSVKSKLKKFALRKTQLRATITTVLREIEVALPMAVTQRVVELVESISALTEGEPHWITRDDSDRARDAKAADALIAEIRSHSAPEDFVSKLFEQLTELVVLRYPARKLSIVEMQEIHFQLEAYRTLAAQALRARGADAAFAADWFDTYESPADYKILFESAEPQLTKNIHIASELENATREDFCDSEWIKPEVRAARKDWLQVLEHAKALSPSELRTFLKASRDKHLEKHPWIGRLQSLIDGTDLSGTVPSSAICELLEVLPFAKFNAQRFADEAGVTLQSLFSSELQSGRVALLSAEERLAAGLPETDHSGECFAKKNTKHGLLSESDVFVWLDRFENPLIQAYTLGHELVHVRQMKSLFKKENRAIRFQDADEFSRFANFYSNYLGISSGIIDGGRAKGASLRKPVFGVGSFVGIPGEHWINSAKEALKRGDQDWNEFLSAYGGWLALSTEPTLAVKVRALRELIPAFENARNLLFAQQVGLELPVDPVRAALPAASTEQVQRLRAGVLAGVEAGFSRSGPELSEALRLIASHQYFGVRFSKTEVSAQGVRLKGMIQTISVGESYNQSQ